MSVDKISFDGNPNIGLYATVTDKFVLLGKEVHERYDSRIEKVLGLPVRRVSMAGTGLIGVFSVWTGDKLLVPGILFDNELRALDSLNIDYEVVDSDLTCLGNNVLIGPEGVIINPEFSDSEKAFFEKATNRRVVKRSFLDVEAVGSLGVIRDSFGLFHRDLFPEDIDFLEEWLGVKIMTGSVNMGNPFVKSGVIVSNDGFLIGGTSGGPEIVNADEALGFRNA